MLGKGTDVVGSSGAVGSGGMPTVGTFVVGVLVVGVLGIGVLGIGVGIKLDGVGNVISGLIEGIGVGNNAGPRGAAVGDGFGLAIGGSGVDCTRTPFPTVLVIGRNPGSPRFGIVGLATVTAVVVLGAIGGSVVWVARGLPLGGVR